MIGAAHGSHDLNLSKATFLLADSRTQFRDMVQSALLGVGAKSVRHAANIDKAIDILNRYGQEITCVFCDWDMAPPGGLELLRRIRSGQLPKTSPRTPVVILTAEANAAAVKIAMALDVNAIVIAPLSIEKIVKTVSLALPRTWSLHPPAHYLAVPSLPTPESPAPAARPPMPKTETPIPHVHAVAAPSVTARVHVTPEPPAKPRAAGNELTNVHMCSLADVAPGQVLARDLRDREGHLLLSTGVELKASLITRLKDVAGGHADSYHLWVGERQNASG